jgi:hypothetical protein
MDDLFAVLSDPTRPARQPRPCRRHVWSLSTDMAPDSRVLAYVYRCARCGHVRSDTASRKGRSSRRLGADQERRIERVYGPRKIGERGDAVDHIGTIGKYQSKASRTKPPAWLSEPLHKMDGLYGERVPVLVVSYVRPGVPVEDYIVIRGRDWLALHGRDEPAEEGA